MLGAGIPKGIYMITTFGKVHRCLREDNLSCNNTNTSNKEEHILDLNRLYHGTNKLRFDEEKLEWICLMLGHNNNKPQPEVTLGQFPDKHSLPLLLDAACLMAMQQIPVL